VNRLVEVDGVGNVPQNMWNAFKTLQNLYKEPLVPMYLGAEEHGAYTDMNSITVGIDNMLKTILENYHEVPDEYKAGSSFFTVGHEFGHITTHPGKDSDYWMNGANNFPIEADNRQKWLNVLSDIIVNWSVMTGSNIRERGGIEKITEELRKGFMSGQFNQKCENIEGHRKLLKTGKNAYGLPMKDNRFKPKGMKIGQFTNGDSDKDYYKPTVNTPFFEQYVGQGRGPQFYPPISQSLGNVNRKGYNEVRISKSVSGLSKGSTHKVRETLTFDGRKNAPYEPIHYYVLDNGKKVNARYVQTLCPDCKKPTMSIWDYWWGYDDKVQGIDQQAQGNGSYIYLMTQLFVYQWAAIYSTFLPYNNKIGRSNSKVFLKDIAKTMDLVMGDE
jgi:hypothetical protein